jgi:uncharacterized RDD family membrane protein YckC
MQQPPPLPSVNPYAAPSARVLDVVDDGDQVLANRGTRLAAAFVDGLIFGGFAVVMAIILPSLAKSSAEVRGLLVIVFFGGILVIAIVNMVLLHRYGQTIAKRMFKIKIARSDGSRCGLARVIFIRALPVSLLGAIPVVGPLISLLDPLLIFREDYRCLHDHIADTIVVKV